MHDSKQANLKQVRDEIASTLGETNRAARRQIYLLVEAMGPDSVRALITEVLDIERKGGMMLPNGQRRHTPGGVFFRLAKPKLMPEQQARIFPTFSKRRSRKTSVKIEISPEAHRTALDIVEKLQDTSEERLWQVERIVEVGGAELALEALEAALTAERQGGLRKKDGTRRSPGGAFLYYASSRMSPTQQSRAFMHTHKSGVHAAARTPEPNTAKGVEITPQARLAAAEIGRRLKSIDAEQIKVIERIVQIGGVDLALEAVDATLSIETQGGLRKKDGTRRSPGGAFLYIASRRLSDQQRQQVWPDLPDDLAPPSSASPARLTKHSAKYEKGRRVADSSRATR